VSRVIFLADTPDAVTPTTIYGKDHQMDLADETVVLALRTAGKAALVGAAIRQPRPTVIGTTTATIGWTVDQACTAMKVDFGTTTAYGSSQAATPAAGTGDIVANLTGLTTATTYHYRVSVTVGTAVTLSPDLTFRTN
jgi:hypothetical protein